MRREAASGAVLREINVKRKRRVVIGRGEDCDVKLGSDRVSRHHCEILYKDGHYELNDLGSTNGTLVNDAEVRSCALADGDLITLGLVNLEFRENQS